MSHSKPLTSSDGEVRVLTHEDMKHALTFHQLPESVRAILRTRGPQKTPTKEAISIRLSQDVLEGFRAMGKGWQAKMDDVLRDYLKSKKLA